MQKETAVALVIGTLFGFALQPGFTVDSVNAWFDQQPAEVKNDFIYANLLPEQRRYIVYQWCSLTDEASKICRRAGLSVPVK